MFPYDDENEETLRDPLASIKSPLVRDYMRQKMAARQRLDAAEKAQKVGDYADVAGMVASDLVNANKPQDAILYNRFDAMGSTPKVSKVADQKIEFTPAKSILDQNAVRAKGKYDQVGKDFEESYKLSQVDRNLQKEDVGSNASKSAQLLAKSAIAAKAKEAEAAGDKEAAKALREMDVSTLSAADAKEFYDSIKATDYKDVLNNQAADKRLNAQLSAEDRRASKALDKDERDMTFKLSKAYSDDDTTKRTVEIRQAKKQAEAYASNPSPTNDIALVFAFMRAQDPRSTVREGEYAMAAQAGGLPQKVQAQYEMALKGQLPADARANMLKTIQAAANAQEQSQKTTDKFYGEQATYYRVKPELVIRGYSPNQQPTEEAPAGATPTPQGQGMVRVQAPNGKVKMVPAEQLEAALQAGGKRVD